ncbi:MAG: dihydroorotase [Muribaculaceae bacterium]
MSRRLILNADIVTGTGDRFNGYVLVEGETIAAVAPGRPDIALFKNAEVTDARNCLLLPGAIDCHVHFREPGLTQKATIASESRAAVAGGVTSFIDMPNTVPQTTTSALVEAKADIAARDSVANYAFFIGATNDNLDELLAADYSRIAGVKLFMGSSTGNMLVDNQSALEALFRRVKARIVVHAEDEATVKANAAAIRAEYGDDAPISLHTRLRSAEACYKASKAAVDLARRTGARLHIAHLSTARELELLTPGPTTADKQITAEVSPHHLLWTEDDYADRGARIKMNPSVKTEADRRALVDTVREGLIDIIATDHAPHRPADKQGSLFKAASGAPMVEFSLIAALSLFTPEVVAERMAAAPARLFAIDRRGSIAPDNYADLVLVDPHSPHTVKDSDVTSLCGWTPVDGRSFSHRVVKTWVNGNLCFDQGVIIDDKRGKALSFSSI